MAASSATVTAKTGAGVSTSSLVLSNVISFSFDCQGNSCSVKTVDGVVRVFAGYSTITVTVSGTVAGAAYTLTLS